MDESGETPPDADLAEADRLGPVPPDPATARRPRARRLIGSTTVDIGPLRRHRDFRLLLAGLTVSYLGSMITYVAIPFQAFALTHSSLIVGLLGVAELAPLLVMAFVGGALADTRDRRRMVQLTELATAGASAVLLGNALLPHPQLWVLFVIAGLMAALDGLQRPSLEAMVPRLVDRDELPAASALSSFRHGVGSVVGPPIGGVLIATAGLPSTYAVDVVSFSVSLAALAAMRASPPPPDAAPVSIRSVVEGVEFAAARPELVGTYVVDIIAMFFGMPMALFPAIADHLGGAGVLGLLYAAPSAGSLLAAGTSGWVDRVQRHGLAVIFAAAGWGLAIVVFGLVNSLPLALGMLALAGAADMISGIYRQTIWNQTVPDHLRGRLAGIEMLSYSTGPLLGNVESGVVAALFSVQASVVSGGIACVVGVAAAAFALPGFRRYRADG